MKNKTQHFVGSTGAPLAFKAKRIEAREWWLWGFAVLVTIVLTFAIVSLVYPGLNISTDSDWAEAKEWVRGLAALVLLFDIYTIYQHLQLSHMRRQLAERNELFQLITENAADMIAVVDPEGRRLYNSPAYQKVLGYSAEELKGTQGLDQIHPDDRERVKAAAEKARITGRGERLEYRMRHKDGSWLIIESTASTVRNSRGDIEKLVIVNRDISDRKRAEESLEYNSLHDGLTRLPNRALFLRQLERAFAVSKRHDDYIFSVLFLDIDEFKLINDSLGHEAGDELLIQLGTRLTASLRALDTVARPQVEIGAVDNGALAKLGGDEYAVLLDDIRHPSDAMRVVRRLEQVLHAPFLIRGHEIVVSVSVGIALNRSSYSEPGDVLRDAEIAMHRAKKSGKSRCELFDSAMHSQAVRRLQIETDLRKGIAQNEIKVFYQPIFSLQNDRIVGFEALSRWQRAGGIVMPGEFIDVADETGLIVPINRQLILESCHNLKSWRIQYPGEPPLFMSVNIPPRQFAHPNLARDIAQILGQAGLEPGGLELEILETVAMGDEATANQILSELKAIGVRLSIDDFGTGYSSLSRLQDLPIDTVKIDRSFITPLDEKTASREIVRTIILLAHAIGLRVVAEGVETEKQAHVLKTLGCDLAQGYFFSRPQNADSVGTLLASSGLAERAR
jgi:diguanylate cyclase (GGDEF)-like protein/PAS domain S-box-containing protein